MDNQQFQTLMNCPVNGMNVQLSSSQQAQAFNSINQSLSNSQVMYQYATTNDNTITLWNYWQNEHYPQVIRHHYPIYLQERAMDKGAKAFEVLKMLQDKGIVAFKQVKDFIEAMDALIKVL